MLISKEVTELGDYQMAVSEYLKLLEQENIIPRIWSKDHTVWNPEPAEISNRLGWLDSPEEMVNNIDEINSFVEEVRAEGYTHALLLGMGGSSLAPEVFRRVFGVKEGWLNLSVLDSTDPAKVLEYAKKLNPKKTLVIASTKSGGTIETLSFVKYFYNWLADALGKEKAGKHYTAITDPGSGLQSLAEKLNFRKIFLNNPDIGGRYSALSYFGLVPAALVGIDIRQLLDRANMMAARCKKSSNLKENPGAYLGAVMGEMAVTGRDKLTLILSPEIAPIGAWLEQLIAESTGKEGKGILPIDGEVLGSPEIYSNDRYFVSIQIGEGNRYQNEINKLQEAGFPVIQLNMETINDLCGEFFHWELATIISTHRLQINPFDQPNVESAKIAAKEMMKSYAASGSVPELTPAIDDGYTKVYTDIEADNPKDALKMFVNRFERGAKDGKGRSYVSIQAFVKPDSEIDKVLQKLRTTIQTKYRLATTVGYGPRFLHSTGQLHKGDSGNGLFIQFTTDNPIDTPIPDEPGSNSSSMSFGILIHAQALGDRQALLDNGRKAIRFHFRDDIASGIKDLAEQL